MVGLYIVTGGVQVSSGTLSIGAFIVNMQMLGAIGEAWGLVYEVALQMQNVLPALMHIVFFMNLPVDFDSQSSLCAWQRNVASKAMQTIGVL